MMRAAVVILATASGPAFAGTFNPPEGCTAYLTVQSKSCLVEHLWTCEADAPGMQWRAEMDGTGVSYVGQIDAEAQWMQSFFLNSGNSETLITPAMDPASLTNLLNEGLDTYDFTVSTPDGPNRVVGFDRITRTDVVIDGEPLQQTEYSIRKTDAEGNVIYEASGAEYVSTEYARFFSGTGDVKLPDGGFSYDNRPIDFIHPGQPGFLNDTPLYGCDALAARYEHE